VGRYWRKAYRRADGTWVRGHWVRSSNHRREPPNSSHPDPPRSYPPPPYTPPPSYTPTTPVTDQPPPMPRKKRRRLAAAVTATAVVTIGGVTYTVTSGGPSSASDGTSIQANVDLGHAVSELMKLGFAGSDNLTTGGSNSAADCTLNSTGEVKAFLTQNPCKEYSVALVKINRQSVSTQAVVSWVMTSPSLAVRYKDIVNERYAGNPPGQPSAFSGICYASGQEEDSVWVAQVQPTGSMTADRQILQAVAPVDLSESYLHAHCIG
jgi:hypothetical protein